MLCRHELTLNYSTTDLHREVVAAFIQHRNCNLYFWCLALYVNSLSLADSDLLIVLRPIQQEWIPRHLLLILILNQVSYVVSEGISLSHTSMYLRGWGSRESASCTLLRKAQTNHLENSSPKAWIVKGIGKPKAWRVSTSWSSEHGWKLESWIY